VLSGSAQQLPAVRLIEPLQHFFGASVSAALSDLIEGTFLKGRRMPSGCYAFAGHPPITVAGRLLFRNEGDERNRNYHSRWTLWRLQFVPVRLIQQHSRLSSSGKQMRRSAFRLLGQ